MTSTQRIQELAPWYHYLVIDGVPTGSPLGLNGQARWEAIRRVLPANLAGLRFLDVGANAGYNSFQAAEQGAIVTAIEGDPRYAAQFRLALGSPERAHLGTPPLLVEDHVQKQPLGDYDIALLGQVHYHLNRSGVPPYRQPRTAPLPHLNPPLAVVLEDLLQSTAMLVITTSEAHLRNPQPLPEAHREWVASTLVALGAFGVEVCPGVSSEIPIIVAWRSQADFSRRPL